MSTIQEIEQAVGQLTREDLAAFRAWFAEFDADVWDRQFAEDVGAGQLHQLADEALQDLRVPPGNRLEKLAGDREGEYSIRINNRWRVCFRWEDAGAHDVEIVDYH